MKTTTLRVYVTQGCIDGGVPASARSCPVAWAVRRAFFEADIEVEGVRVIGYCMHYRLKKKYTPLDLFTRLPCFDWISRYDKRNETSLGLLLPISFDLEVLV